MTNIIANVTIVNGIPRVLSTDIAERFGKPHDQVLKVVRRIVDDLDPDFGLVNFDESSYVNEQGKEQPCYSLTRDAFSLVAMSFTGKAALQWKVKYIEAFNALEQELVGRTQLPSNPCQLTKTTSTDRSTLTKLIKVWSIQTRTHLAQCWTMLNAHLGLDSIDDLPLERLREALDFVQARIDSEGRTKALPQAPAQDTTTKAELAEARKSYIANIELLHKMADILQIQVTGKVELFKEMTTRMLAEAQG